MTTVPNEVFPAAPEVGQLVRVRDRHWVVADVQASTIGGAWPQHLVELQSVEDDDLSDELAVIWEIEGTAVLEAATLPRPAIDRFDNPVRLDAFLDAVFGFCAVTPGVPVPRSLTTTPRTVRSHGGRPT